MAAIPNPNAYSDALYRVTYAWGLTFLPHALKIAFLGSNGYQWDNRLGMFRLPLSLSLPSILYSPSHFSLFCLLDDHSARWEMLASFGFANVDQAAPTSTKSTTSKPIPRHCRASSAQTQHTRTGMNRFYSSRQQSLLQ